jgi:PAS domain S-box-containing protein
MALTDKTAAWYQAAVESLDDQAVVAIDASGRVCVWTAAAERLTGHAAADVLGQPYDFLAAASGGPAPARVMRAVESEGRFETARWWRRADSSLFWAHEVVKTTPAPDGDEPFYTLIVRDASEQQGAQDRDDVRSRREEEAHNREGRLRDELQVAEWRASFLAEASSILVASSLDFDGTIKGLARLAVSRLCTWCVVHALDADGEMRRLEIAHRDPRRERGFGVAATGALRGQSASPVLAVLRTGAGQIIDQVGDSFYQALADDADEVGQLRQFGASSAMIVPLLGRGKVLGTVTLVADAHGAEYDEEDLAVAEELARRAAIAIDNARLYREAQEANRAKADFLAVMSHELRTPLNAIMGYSDLLDAEISGPVLPKQRRQLSRIRASARHLLQLIEEILAFARMEEGGEEVLLEEVDAAELTRDAIAAVEPMATAKGLELIAKADASLALRTDTSKVRQILVNLLSNAIKFTEAGSVTLTTEAGQGSLVFTITDTGIGISQEQLERIFEPFWQAERPTTRRVGGTGLGLSVSRRFARLLGGDIQAESMPGQGARFRVELPVSSVQLQRRNPLPAKAPRR